MFLDPICRLFSNTFWQASDCPTSGHILGSYCFVAENCQMGWFQSKIHNYSKSLLEGCVLPNNLPKLNQHRHGLLHGKILMLVAGLICHQTEVKNDRNRPTLLEWFQSPNTSSHKILHYIAQYNQQGGLITWYKFFNKYFTFPLNSTWGLEEDFSVCSTYSPYKYATENFEPLQWRKIFPRKFQNTTLFYTCVELS